MTEWTLCPACEGTGDNGFGERCSWCQGIGEVEWDEDLEYTPYYQDEWYEDDEGDDTWGNVYLTDEDYFIPPNDLS